MENEPTNGAAPSQPAPLSARALGLLRVLFSRDSNVQVPVALADEVTEIRAWVDAQARATEGPTP